MRLPRGKFLCVFFVLLFQMAEQKEETKPLRVLFLSLELVEPIFSGNGVYSRSLVRSLSSFSSVELLVVSGRPSAQVVEEKEKREGKKLLSFENDPLVLSFQKISREQNRRVKLETVVLDKWWRLDRQCSWKEFALGQAEIIPLIESFSPQIIAGVDWSTLEAYQYIKDSLPSLKAPFVYLNFRVFCNSPGLTDNEQDRQFYVDKETEAMALAVKTVALSRYDMETLLSVWEDKHKERTPKSQERDIKGRLSYLLPPLRQEIFDISTTSSFTPLPFSTRKYITCCVRLSPEKNSLLFVELMELLAEKDKEGNDFFSISGLTPLLCGSEADREYAQETKRRLKKSVPQAVIHDFVSPAQLAQIYQESRLNFHPSLMDAYGMTVVEAAAFGTPSIINAGWSVGVRDLLDPTKQEIITYDLSSLYPPFPSDNISSSASPTASAETVYTSSNNTDVEKMKNQRFRQFASFLRTTLLNLNDLESTGLKAQIKSRSWDESANGRTLLHLLSSIAEVRSEK